MTTTELILLIAVFLIVVVVGQNLSSWRDDTRCDEYVIEVEGGRAEDYTLVK